MYDEERYVLAAISKDEPVRCRLLSTTAKGARMVWVSPDELEKIDKYIKPNDDTDTY